MFYTLHLEKILSKRTRKVSPHAFFDSRLLGRNFHLRQPDYSGCSADKQKGDSKMIEIIQKPVN